jgi:hypothetical protein
MGYPKDWMAHFIIVRMYCMHPHFTCNTFLQAGYEAF